MGLQGETGIRSGSLSLAAVWESCSGEGACWGNETRAEREGHLGVGVLDEEIHYDHDQDGDGNTKVPNDPSQLRAGGGTSD